MNNNSNKKRDFVYAGKTQTNILLEIPAKTNPYVSQKNYIHGYDLAELVSQKSFVDTLLLLFTGELPSLADKQLFERLMVALINLGPRHPAVKASMVAGVSKTNTEHLLPIGLNVLAGEQNGALEVANAVSFIQQHLPHNPQLLANDLMANYKAERVQGEAHLVAGFGNQYGSIDELCQSLANHVLQPYIENNTKQAAALTWVLEFCQCLNQHNLGLLKTGLAAAVFCQLGIPARESIGLFQIICAPGIFAHGVEQTHKPITAMPMLADEQHIYTGNQRA